VKGGRTPRVAVAGAVVTILAVTLLSCGRGGDEVASLGTAGTGGRLLTPEDKQARSAEEYLRCMTEADIPMWTKREADGQLWVEIDSDWASSMVSRDRDGLGRQKTISDEEAAEFFSRHPEEPALLLDGRDASAEYGDCLDSSGYASPVVSREQEWAVFDQSLADASNLWAKCARENGYPNIVDTSADAYPDYSPGVILPNDITVDQLRDLLQTCPNFDSDQAKAVYEETADYIPSPVIYIDGIFGPGENSAFESSDAQRAEELTEVLFAQQRSFDAAMEASRAATDNAN